MKWQPDDPETFRPVCVCVNVVIAVGVSHVVFQMGIAKTVIRAVTKALIGGGGAYSYIRVLPDEFLLKSTVMATDFKRNSSGRTRIYEYPPPN